CNIQTVTVPNLPPVHPAPAILPATFSIAQPSTAGCTVQDIAADLSDFQTKLNTAAANQPANCQILNLAPGTVGNVHLIVPTAAEADQINASDSNFSTQTLTKSTSHS